MPPSRRASMKPSTNRYPRRRRPQCGSCSPWLLLAGSGRRRKRFEHRFARHRKLFGRTISFLVSYNTMCSTV
jgi:hypothetical protein